jgi:hypothetical protein
MVAAAAAYALVARQTHGELSEDAATLLIHFCKTIEILTNTHTSCFFPPCN